MSSWPLTSPQRDLYFLSHPELWVCWPFLPVVRRAAGVEDYGVLFDALTACNLAGHRCTVYLTNLFTLPPNLQDFLALPREVYDTLEEVVAAGWRVD